jgi:hypothetical protein
VPLPEELRGLPPSRQPLAGENCAPRCAVEQADNVKLGKQAVDVYSGLTPYAVDNRYWDNLASASLTHLLGAVRVVESERCSGANIEIRARC